MTRIEEISEKEWIEKARRFVDKGTYLVGHEDALVEAFEGGQMVINIDGFVGSTDRPSTMPWIACGYKAVVGALSDIVSKGGMPLHIVVSLSLPADFMVEDSLDILRGIRKACDDYGIKFLGGDLNNAKDVVIDVVAVGRIIVERPIPRRGQIELGDYMYWLGPPFGSTGFSLKALLDANSKISEEVQAIVDVNFFYPKLRMEFLDLIQSLPIKAAMDCSDGVAATICEMLKETGKSVTLFENEILRNSIDFSRFNVEIDEHIPLIFHSGEEYGIVFITERIPDSMLEKFGIVCIGTIELKELSFYGKAISCSGWDSFTKLHNK